jgi:hypothetical protein
MYGDTTGYISADTRALSDDHNSSVDLKVQEILRDSKKRVSDLLQSKEQ